MSQQRRTSMPAFIQGDDGTRFVPSREKMHKLWVRDLLTSDPYCFEQISECKRLKLRYRNVRVHTKEGERSYLYVEDKTVNSIK